MDDLAREAWNKLEKERALRLLDERVKRLERESDEFGLRVRYIVSQVELERQALERVQTERTRRETDHHA